MCLLVRAACHHASISGLVAKGSIAERVSHILCRYSCAILHYTKSYTRPHKYPMAKARTSLRNAEAIDVHEDPVRPEEGEETMDESTDPLDESGQTVDSSDEEVEDSVQEDMARFEETFVGISKRFRLINRIGEGMYCFVGLQ